MRSIFAAFYPFDAASLTRDDDVIAPFWLSASTIDFADVDFAVDLDIINKSGSWFSYNGERLGQGRENVKKVFEENEELYNEIYGLVRDEIMSKTGKKNNSADEEESNDNIDELDLGIETLGEVE